MSCAHQKESKKDFYNRQNRKIHKARAQLSMSLDECRELAKEIGGKPSISSLSLKERWILIEELKAKGAKVFNPQLPNNMFSGQSSKHNENAKDIYPTRLARWNKRFPNRRPGFASNEQLAWIEAFWDLDFNDDRSGSGLRGFIYRQTKNLKKGPVSDLAFLRGNHVAAVMMPLKAKAREKHNQ